MSIPEKYFQIAKQGKKLPPFQHSGILLIDKPAVWTSHDVINFVRMKFNIKKAGHCGTLDPAATGLLVVLLGHATKLSGKFIGQDKSYSGTMILGIETDSGDMDGKIIAKKDASNISKTDILQAFAKFTGSIRQLPPMVSAVKKDGKKLYELARAGITVEREAKEIIIYSLELQELHLPYVNFFLKCSKGTYVRALCSDIGNELGCGAALNSLRRLSSGNFSIETAFDIDTIASWTQDDLYRNISNF